MNEETAQERIERYLRIAVAVYMVLLVLAMYPATVDPTGDIKRLITALAAFGLMAWWALAVGWYGIPVRRPRLFFEVLVCFLGLYVLSTIRSEFRWFSLLDTGGFISLFALYILASQVYHTPAQVLRLFWVMCGAVGCSSLYGMLQKAGVDPFPWADRTSDVYMNLPATFGNPNFAAHMLILTIILGILLLTLWRGSGEELAPSVGRRRAGLLLALALIALFLVHMRFTGQRAGIIALAAALLLMVVAWIIGRRFRKPLTGAVVSLALVAALGFAGMGGAMAVSKMKGGIAFPMDTSLLIRYQSYVSAADMLFDRPVLGHGPGVYAITYSKYWTPFEKDWFAQELRVNNHVHNDVIEIGIDAGLLAAGLYVSLLALGMGYGLLMAFSAASPVRRRMGYAYAALFLAFLVDGLFGFNLRVPVSAVALFLLLGTFEGIWTVTDPQAQKRSVGVVRWAFVTVLLLAAVLSGRTFASQYYLQQGSRALAMKEYAKAKELFTRGQHMTPWDWQFERRLGLTCLAELDPQGAVEHFDRSLAINPNYIMTRLPMGHAKLMIAQRIMQTDNTNVAEALKTLDEATDHLNAMLAVCPAFADAHELLGRIASFSAAFVGLSNTPESAARAQQYWKVAEDHLQKAIRFSIQKKAEYYRMLAKVRMALDNTDGAEQALVHAVEADATDTETWPLFLEFANKHKRYDRARNALVAQLRRLNDMEKPDKNALGTVYLCLANVLENGFNDQEGVEKAYWGALENSPLRPEVWTNLARYAQDKNRGDFLKTSVAQTCGRLAVTDQKPLAYVAAVNGVLQKGAPELEHASAVVLSHIRAHKPTDPLSVEQAYGWAARLLLEVLQASPDAEVGCGAYLNLGISFAGLERLDLADQLFVKTKSCIDPEREAFLALHWADTMVRQNRFEEAIALLREARDKHPDNLDGRWALARTLAKNGRIEEARVEYTALLQESALAPEGRSMLEREMKGL